MLENPIINPTPNAGVKGNNPGLKTAEYQAVKGMRFGFKWIGIGIRSTIALVIDAFKMMVGRE